MTEKQRSPLVSILITCYNREKYIKEAIESVLASSFSDFELIILDDGSTDYSFDIIRSFTEKDKRIRIYQNKKNIGQFPNRNRAASLAQGKYIKFLDSDDSLSAKCLELMVAAMQANKHVAIACEDKSGHAGNFNLYTSKDLFYRYFSGKLSLLNIGPTGTIMLRSAFEAVGGFDESVGVFADTHLSMKLALQYNFVGFEPHLFIWREHGGQVTAQIKKDHAQAVCQKFLQHCTIIQDSQFPFPPVHKKMLLSNLKNIVARKCLKMGFLDLKGGRDIANKCDLTFLDFARCVLPNKKLMPDLQ